MIDININDGSVSQVYIGDTLIYDIYSHWFIGQMQNPGDELYIYDNNERKKLIADEGGFVRYYYKAPQEGVNISPNADSGYAKLKGIVCFPYVFDGKSYSVLSTFVNLEYADLRDVYTRPSDMWGAICMGCNVLKYVNLDGWNIEGSIISNLGYKLFSNCPKLKTIDGNFKININTNISFEDNPLDTESVIRILNALNETDLNLTITFGDEEAMEDNESLQEAITSAQNKGWKVVFKR